MLKTNISVQNLKSLDNHIGKVNRTLSQDKLNKFIQKKSFEALLQVMQERLVGGTTNDGSIALYQNSNHIQELPNGFIMYNDAQIVANAKDTSGYKAGMFSIALAFEYGVGIIGEGTANPNAWDYNINNYNFGWSFTDENGNKVSTYGYMGFEIYRYTADRINKSLKKWLREYYSTKEVQL